MRSLPLFVLLLCSVSGGHANRVYIHPFTLFASPNVSCETLSSPPATPLETLAVAPLDAAALAPDARDPSTQDGQRQNFTVRTAVLAGLLNPVGLRMYQALSRRQDGANTLLSPVNTCGSLVTFYLGASKTTARSFQSFLGLTSGTDRADCVSLFDGHKVLQTLQSINHVLDDGPNDEITTQVWTFARQGARLAEDFVQGTQDFSDVSFVRGVDFSEQEEAEQLLNSFVEKTSVGRVKGIFKNLNSTSNLLFISSFNFQGNWRTAFQPERTSMQEFHVDESTTVMVPLMTHTGRYQYLIDNVQHCTVVKLSLSKHSYMLLVLPDEGGRLQDIESKLLTGVMSHWHTQLQEGLLELSLPKFSMSAVNDLHDLLTHMDLEVEARLLGSQAEFSQLSDTKPFTIDEAINRVSFEMSEEGAQPAETTQEDGIPLRLSINRPFFFTVIEGDSDAILLLGKVINPTL